MYFGAIVRLKMENCSLQSANYLEYYPDKIIGAYTPVLPKFPISLRLWYRLSPQALRCMLIQTLA